RQRACDNPTVRRLCLVLLAACGRLGFAPVDDSLASDGGGTGDTGDGGGMIDAAPFVSACPVGTTAPPMVSITGSIVRLSTMGPVPDLTVTVAFSLDGTPVATDVTDGGATFELDIPTGGQPVVPFFRYGGSNIVPVILMPGRAYDASTGVIWGADIQVDLDVAYNEANLSPQAGAGTVYISATDCDGNSISGVTVTTTPSVPIVDRQSVV